MSNCYSCKYKCNVPGDAHISCEYPLLDKGDAFKISMLAMANPTAFNSVIKESFGFTGAIHGIQSGWFMFPTNYDPSWIEGSCNKHSDLVGEAVEYQLSLNKCLDPYKQLFVELEKGEKSKEEYAYIMKAYEDALKVPVGLAESSEEVKAEARIKLVEELEKALSLLKEHKEAA